MRSQPTSHFPSMEVRMPEQREVGPKPQSDLTAEPQTE